MLVSPHWQTPTGLPGIMRGSASQYLTGSPLIFSGVVKALGLVTSPAMVAGGVKLPPALEGLQNMLAGAAVSKGRWTAREHRKGPLALACRAAEEKVESDLKAILPWIKRLQTHEDPTVCRPDTVILAAPCMIHVPRHP